MRRAIRCLYEILLSLSILLVCTACNRTEPVKVDLKTVSPIKKPSGDKSRQTLRIGMGAMITPKEGYEYYQLLQQYIEKKLGLHVQLVDRDNYDEMNKLLETGGVDAAFVCAGPYLEGQQKFNLELLAMPVVNGKPVYYSYIIVHRDSTFKRLEDLRGKTFAFADPKSNSGKLVPTYMLAQLNETPDSFFASYQFSYGHDQSVKAVAEKLVDGAAVDSLIWEYMALKTPKLTGQTRIIAKSAPYGIPPVVVRPGFDPVLKMRLRDVLISAANDAEGREILKGMMIERFVPGNDANYNSIREMDKWLAKQRKQK